MSVRRVDPGVPTAWKEGIFIFDRADLAVVTRQMERWYGVTFTRVGEGREGHTFSGNFSKYNPLETILDALTFAGGPRFKIDNDTVYIMEK
jgi:hypothetical protein